MNDLITMHKDTVTTTSLIIAEHFGKQHKNVLQAIENLECSPEFRALNFKPTLNVIPMPNGASRNDPAFEITRDGFAFLAMGFTGKEAAAWKERFLEAFNAMEKEIGRLRHENMTLLQTQRDEAVKIMFKAMPMLAERDASIAKADTAKTLRAANNDKGTIKSLQKRVDELENTVVDLQLISMSIALTGQIPTTEVSSAVQQKLKDIQLSAEKAVNWYRKRGAILSKPVEAHFRMITEANL